MVCVSCFVYESCSFENPRHKRIVSEKSAYQLYKSDNMKERAKTWGKKVMKSALLAVSFAAMPFTASADAGVEIHYLGENNTLVRVTGEGRYLLLPVQDTNDDARIHVLADGKIDKTIHVRLAKTKVDYYVPFDLTPYKGHQLLLNVVTTQGRASAREAKEDVCWKNIRVSDVFDTTNRERFRPAFHHTPLYGWMNDPNGMFYKDGRWHLYYQYNPYGSKWQNMTWGHSSSADLVRWTHHSIAIEPNGIGTVFSGSSALDPRNTAGFGENAVIALYTSADISQTQSLAWSNDGGETFNVYPGNPVLTLETEARDPNMFWHEGTGRWVMLLAHALEHEMLIYSSSDMKSWKLESRFGEGLGAQDGVWECPDLFELSVDGENEKKWVLLCNLNPGGPFGGSATQYFIGEFDGKTFTPDKDENGNVPTKWLDYGKDHYATVSWSDAPDNRRTVIGWMSNWQYAAEVPTMQFRSANTLPREMGLFRGADGQIYASCTPSPEVLSLRGRLVRNTALNIGNKARTVLLPTENDGVCEILINIDAQKAAKVNLELSNSVGDKVQISYDAMKRNISFDRRTSGIVDFSQDFPAVTVSPTFENDGKVALRIFVDRSSIELFERDGRFVMTNLVFPNTPYTTLSMSAEGGSARIGNIQVYSIKAEQ